MSMRIMFRWYDLWIGAYWDRFARVLYVCPVPMLVLRFAFNRPRFRRLAGERRINVVRS